MFYTSNQHRTEHGDSTHVMERYKGLKAWLLRFDSSLSPAWAGNLTTEFLYQKSEDGSSTPITELLSGLNVLMITKHLE